MEERHSEERLFILRWVLKKYVVIHSMLL